MRRVAVGAGVSVVLCLVTAATAQDIEVSSLDLRHTNMESISAAVETREHDARYIVDVSGRQVRLVGPRFFPDNSKDVELLGRAQALAREDARTEVASK